MSDRVADNELVERYEVLRQRRCSDEDGGDRLGLAVLLERGMSEWLHQQASTMALGRGAESSTPRTPVVEHGSDAVVPGRLSTELARLLAVMAIESVQSTRNEGVR